MESGRRSGVEKSSSSSSSSKGKEIRSDDNRFLFLFVRREDGVYLLYKIDFVNCLKNNPDVQEIPLSPLIVFSKKSQVNDCYFDFVYLEPYFYFIGGDINKIFTISKSDLVKIDPSEKRHGSNLLEPLASQMHGTKLYPLAFTYQNKLYVISKGYFPLLQQIGKNYFEFEVYNPETQSWTDLGNKPLRECCITSHLVLNDMVYFTTTIHVILSFNLIDEKWVTIFDPYGVLVHCPDEFYAQPLPTFDTDIQIICNTIFGGIIRLGNSFIDISASSSLIPSDDMFLRPSLTHDKRFYDIIYSVPRQLRLHASFCSKSLVTIDNDQGIICVIGYGNEHSSDRLANYAILTFFRVNGDSYQGDVIHEPEPEQEVGKEPVLPYHWINLFHYARDKENIHVNFFRADFISATFMPIDTKKQVTHGVVYRSLIA